MKKIKILTYASVCALLSLVGFSACSSGDSAAAEPVTPSPNYNPVTDEVVAQFVFNLSLGNTPSMRMTSAATQAVNTETFRGIDKAGLFSYKQSTDGKHLATPENADKRFDIARILGRATITKDKSHRVIETSLPLNTNTLLFYGKAIRGTMTPEQEEQTGLTAKDVYGWLEKYTLANGDGDQDLKLSDTTFELQSRIEDHKEAFERIESLLAGIMTCIMNTNLAGENHVKLPKDECGWSEDIDVDKYPNVYWADFNSANGMSPIEHTHVLYALEVKMADAYREMTTIKQAQGELRAGYGTAILSTIQNLWSVVNEVRCATPFSVPEAVAKYMAERIHERIKQYFNGTVPSNGMNVTEVSYETMTNLITHFTSDTAWPTTADKRPDAAYYESIKGTKLVDFPQKSYRVPVGSTHYLFDKDKKQFYYVKNYNTSGVGDGTGFTVESYYYPPELLYFGNSPLRISNQEHKPEHYPDGVANWDDDKNWDTSSWTKNSHVTSATQSVAMVNDINYGTSLLKTTVSFGSSILRDNNHAIQKDKDPTITEEDEPDKRITADAGLFQLNGVIIGGQWKQVGWNFLPKGDKQGYVYDCDIASPDIPTPASTPNYTLVFDNYNALMAKQDKVYVALELINNGEMFFGEHGMIPHGGIFYLIGELDPNKAGLEKPTWPQHHPLPPYNADGSSIETARVFMQDYMTTANFVIGENSLKHAYMTVPDLRYSALTLGMSVDINWSTGIDFGDVILGGDGANNTGN